MKDLMIGIAIGFFLSKMMNDKKNLPEATPENQGTADNNQFDVGAPDAGFIENDNVRNSGIGGTYISKMVA